MQKLAMHGETKSKTSPYHKPNKYGDVERRYLMEVIDEGSLMLTSGSMVKRFERAAATKFGCKHAILTTSGTIATQVALVACGVEEGDEVIVTAIADAGTFMSILALSAVPVFADMLPDTVGPDPGSVERLISDKTKAIMVVHMAGIIANMDVFLEIGRKHGISIIEDGAQAHGGKWKGKYVGTMGRAGIFSMNEAKHMSTGDGGFITTDDDELAKVARLYIDKTYARGEVRRGDEALLFASNNFRPNCLTAAVALAQLEKLDQNISRRDEIVQRYYGELNDLPYLYFPKIEEGAECAWWPLPVLYQSESPSRDEIVAALLAEGLEVNTGLSPNQGSLHTLVIKNKKFYPYSDHVPHFLKHVEYDEWSCPAADEVRRTVIRLPVDYRYTDQDITETIEGIRKVWSFYFAENIVS